MEEEENLFRFSTETPSDGKQNKNKSEKASAGAESYFNYNFDDKGDCGWREKASHQRSRCCFSL
jgi:hypothetical protein